MHDRPAGLRRPVRALLAVVALVTACLALAAPPAPTGAQTPPARPARAPGPLSERLERLVPAVATQADPAGIAAATSSAVEGPGSLLRRPDGRFVVEITVADTGPTTLDGLRIAGASVISVSPSVPVVTAEVPAAALHAVAASRGVIRVDEVLTPEVGGTGLTGEGQSGAATSAACATGTVSEGDTQLRAALARSTYGVDGTGVRVGVLSDSYDNLGGAATDVAAAELPGPGNPCGRTTPVTVQADLASGGTDEGRAMAQIVHDLAPGSPLSFATAFNGPSDFATQIVNLKNNGAKVIVDDITYYNEPMYQDGAIAKAVADVHAAGVSYYSSSANSTVTVGGKSVGSYETGGYRATTCPASVTARGEVDCHDFDPGTGADAGDTMTVPNGKTLRFSLGWNQPAFGVTTDLDAYLLDSGGNIVAKSEANNRAAAGTPYEFISWANSTGTAQTYRLVIGRFTGPDVRFKVIFHRAPFTSVQWNTAAGGDTFGPTAFGHNIARFGASVAAVPYSNAATVESYSSRGPATYCWAAQSGFTPAAALPACETRTIDLAATDGTRNSFFGALVSGVFRFYGTSAAAPHAAATAALLRQKDPCRTPAEVLAAQKAGATAVGAFGVNDVGAGLVRADVAIGAALGCTAQTLTFTTPPPVGAANGTSFGVSASATSGLAVTIATTGPCSGGGIGAATISTDPSATGTCTISLSQAGNADYAPGAASATVTVVARSGALLSVSTPGGAGSDIARAVKVDAAGNTYVVGRIDGSTTFGSGPDAVTLVPAGGTDGFLARYAPDGSLAWAQRFGSTGADEGWDVALDAGGNPVITGGFDGAVAFGSGPSAQYVNGSDDLFVAAYTASGGLSWIRTAAGPGVERGFGLTIDTTGNVTVVGAFSSPTLTFTPTVSLTTAGGVDGFAARYSSTGGLWWARRIGGSGTQVVRATAALPSGAVAITGYADTATTFGNSPTLPAAGGYDGFVAVLGAGGSTQWAVPVAGTGTDVGWAVTTDAGGDVYATGLFSGAVTVGGVPLAANSLGTDAYVVRFSGGGDASWATALGGALADGGEGIAVAGSTVRVAGTTTGAADADGILWSLTTAGTPATSVPMGAGTGTTYANGLAVDAAGDVTVVGLFGGTATFGAGVTAATRTSAGGDDVFVARVGA